MGERVQKSINAAHAVVKAAFPEAGFQVHCGDAPEGIHIDAYTNADKIIGLTF